MSMVRKHFVIVAIAVAAIGLALAGGAASIAQDASPEAGTPAASPAASPMASPSAGGGDEVTVEMVDIDFNPNEFSIPANTDVTVMLPNDGAAVHNFNIDELDVSSGDIDGGAEGEVTINAEAGEYEYYCDIPGHKEAGMVGTLTVE